MREKRQKKKSKFPIYIQSPSSSQKTAPQFPSSNLCWESVALWQPEVWPETKIKSTAQKPTWYQQQVAETKKYKAMENLTCDNETKKSNCTKYGN